MSVRDEIQQMIREAKFAGPNTVLRVSPARYQWLKDGALAMDSPWSADVDSGLVGSVEVVVDPTLSGMDYSIDNA